MTVTNSFDSQYEFLRGFAEQQLVEYGEFFPFASFVDPAGILSPLAAYRDHQHLGVAAMRNQLEETILDLISTQRIVAAGICINATVDLGGRRLDALVFELENSAGEAATVTLPYAKGELGALAFSDLKITQRAPRWFITPPDLLDIPRQE